MGGATNGLVSKVGNLANMFKSFGKAGSVGLAIGGFAGTIALISNGIKSSEKNTIEWKKQLAQIKPLMDGIDSVLERIGRGFITLVGALSNLGKWIGSGFNYKKVMKETNDNLNESVQLIDREVKNEQELQQLQLDEITTQKEINKLRDIANDSDRYTYKEREAAVKKIGELEKSLEDRKVAAAKEAYEIQVANRKGEQASVEERKKEQEL